MSYWLKLETWMPANWNLDIGQIITDWNMYSYIALTLFILMSCIAFSLSYRSYDENDETPVGFKVLFGINAAMWNVLYLLYYFVTVGLIGL